MRKLHACLSFSYLLSRFLRLLQLSRSSQFFVSIVHEALKQCGHSPDLVQIVTGFAETGQALIQSNIDKLTFIGSPGVGKHIMRAASDNLTPVVLELGGKDAAVVCDDCDYDQVIQLALRGTFQNCGQNCIGLERLVVHAGIYDKFVLDMERKVRDSCLVSGAVPSLPWCSRACNLPYSVPVLGHPPGLCADAGLHPER